MKRLSNLPPGVTDAMIEAQAAPRYEVVASKVWLNAVTGQKVSPYGAIPWTSDAEKTQWKLVNQGWAIYDSFSNTYGCGRPPFENEQDAQALCDKFNSR